MREQPARIDVGGAPVASDGPDHTGPGPPAVESTTDDDPLRAIQSLPSATATDDFHSEFAVRGNPFRYVGLVVDGVPTRYLMHTANIDDGGSIAMINSETLSSVSLLPGSYPQRTGRQLGAVGLSNGDRANAMM